MDNIELGAIGIIVIHNNADDPANEVDIRLDPQTAQWIRATLDPALRIWRDSERLAHHHALIPLP